MDGPVLEEVPGTGNGAESGYTNGNAVMLRTLQVGTRLLGSWKVVAVQGIHFAGVCTLQRRSQTSNHMVSGDSGG